MTAELAELEAALRECWDRATLEVYGDALQAAGDPRGELVALDLHLEGHGPTRAHTESWQRAMTAWLGEAWARLGPWEVKAFRFGFLEDLRIGPRRHLSPADYCRAVLASPVGPFVRGASIADDARGIREALAAIAGEDWPWLERLSIVQPMPRDAIRSAAPPALAGVLGGSVPRLREIAIRGQRVIAAPLPASVQRLVIDGEAALEVGSGASDVVEIDLRIDVASRRELARLAERLGPAPFPKLARLDLSRCENSLMLARGWGDPLALVAALAAPERLRALRIARPIHQAQVEALAELRARWPALDIELAGAS